MQHRFSLNVSNFLYESWKEDESGAHLEVVARHVDADDAGGAAHAGQVVRQDVRAHLEVVHHHGRQRGGRRKAGAHHNQDVDLQHINNSTLSAQQQAHHVSLAQSSRR